MAWEQYLKKTSNWKPRPLLLEALPYVKGKNVLDLGAGSLSDAHYLTENGFRVTALDKNPKVLEYAQPDDNLIVYIAPFCEFEYQENFYDLVNAQYALPFEKPEEFNTTFHKILKSMKEGAIFTGQLFGVDDGWAEKKEMTFHSTEQITALSNYFSNVRVLREEKKIGPTVTGEDKMWHVFHIIAEK